MSERDMIFGVDCWVITAGLTLGAGCVVGAGAAVMRDVPAGAVVGGVPAGVIRLRGKAHSLSAM